MKKLLIVLLLIIASCSTNKDKEALFFNPADSSKSIVTYTSIDELLKEAKHNNKMVGGNDELIYKLYQLKIDSLTHVIGRQKKQIEILNYAVDSAIVYIKLCNKYIENH